jgi:hypothetical protein
MITIESKSNGDIKMKNIHFPILVILLAVLSIACSKSGNPVSIENPGTFPQSDLPEISTTDSSHADSPNLDTRGVFGAWRVVVDPIALTAEMVPARNAQAIGLIVDADLSQFLLVSPCADCMQISRIYLDGYNDLAIDLKMKHPFPSASARPDLHGFDVRAIFIFDQLFGETYSEIKVMDPTGTENDALITNPYRGLLNADGYTSHYDELVLDTRYFIHGSDKAGNLNPFLRFFESYSDITFDPAAPTGWNVMPTGSSIDTRTAVFDGDEMLAQPFEMYIVADVAYGQSAVLANRQNPQYYLPAFNRTEPWRIEYWIENNNLTWSDPLSSADVMVQVFDWQHSATVDTSYPNPANLGGIPESSKVAQLVLSVPALQNAPTIETAPQSGTGRPGSPLLYKMTVINENQYNGNTYGLLAVRDELYGQTGRVPIPSSPKGFPYETLDILDYAYYQYIEINMPGIGMFFPFVYSSTDHDLYVQWDDLLASESYTGVSTTIHPDFFMDLGHTKFQYDWDYDYDGITFDVDGSGAPSPELNFSGGGRNDIGLRIRTNSDPPQEYIYTLPVWAEGIAYQEMTTPATGLDTTSTMKNHAVAVTDDHFYFVYPNEVSGTRNIFLTILDNDGNATTHQVTGTSDPSYMPSVAVIDDGVNDGIYVAFCEYNGATSFAYATYGNLDGTGFTPGNTKRVSASIGVSELFPMITNFNDELHVYYNRVPVGLSRVYGGTSTDFGLTWVDNGWMVNNTSDQQGFATMATAYSTLYLVWEDLINATDYGSDLYIGQTTDGVTFTNIRNISMYRGLINETTPSMSYKNGVLAISYLVYFMGDPHYTTNIMLYSPYSNCFTNIPFTIGLVGDSTHTQPSIFAVSAEEFQLAVGVYDYTSMDLTQYLYNLNLGNSPGELYYDFVYSENVGNLTSLTQTFNALASRQVSMNAVETLAVWRTFTNNYLVSPTFPSLLFGDVEYMNFVSEKVILTGP